MTETGFFMKVFLGIDISKATFAAAAHKDAELLMEATGSYYFLLADMAFSMGISVFVVNPRFAKRYREFCSPRAKTDRVDATALARMLERERDDLRAYRPLPPSVRIMISMLRRRHRVIQGKQKIVMSLGSEPAFKKDVKAITARLDAMLKGMEQKIEELAKELPGYKNLMSIKGIGLLSAASLIGCFERGEFKTADALVAYLGLDTKACDSSQKKGKRRLSKAGDACTRGILYMAAKSASQTAEFRDYYQSLKSRGLKATEALVVLMRKLVRIAWALYTYNRTFEPKVVEGY